MGIITKSIVLVIVALFLITLVTVPSVQPVHAALSWSAQIVDTNAVAIGNGYVPIVVDSNNIPHIGYSGSYNSHTGKRGGYATLNGSDWITQKIPDGWVTDLKLDTNDTPHMTLDRGAYIRWTGTEWYSQAFSSTERFIYASLALDSSGNPHIAYDDSEGLKYASLTGSSWDIQTVDASYPKNSGSFSLALDKNDIPYILYANSSQYQDDVRVYNLVSIKLAILKDTEWSIEPILASFKFYDCWNMFLDSKGYPRFLATLPQPPTQPQFLQTILYVSWDGSAWNMQTVASDVYLNIYGGSLALDRHDNPNIVYSTRDNELKYAFWTGTDWNIQTKDTNMPMVTWTGTDWEVQNDTTVLLSLMDHATWQLTLAAVRT